MTAIGDGQSDWDLFSAIRKEELAASIVSGRVQVVNVLEAPKTGRLRLIAHSRHIPLSELEERLGELDRGRDVVVYCKNRECPASLKAARLLAEQGFHVRAYEGGIEEWVTAGLPTDADTKKLPRTETAALDPSASSVRTPPTKDETDKGETEKGETEEHEPVRGEAGETPAPENDEGSRRASSAQDDAPPTERASQAGAAPREEEGEYEREDEEKEEEDEEEEQDEEEDEREAEPRAAARSQPGSANAATEEEPEDSMRPMANSFLDCLSAPPSERST